MYRVVSCNAIQSLCPELSIFGIVKSSNRLLSLGKTRDLSHCSATNNIVRHCKYTYKHRVLKRKKKSRKIYKVSDMYDVRYPMKELQRLHIACSILLEPVCVFAIKFPLRQGNCENSTNIVSIWSTRSEEIPRYWSFVNYSAARKRSGRKSKTIKLIPNIITIWSR